MRHDKKSPSVIFLLVVFLFLPRSAFALSPLSVSVHVDKKTATLGDEIVYEISATHPTDVLVKFPGEEIDFSPFELKRYRPLSRREAGEEVTEGFRYFLTIFKLGVWKIPPVTISYTDYRKRDLPESSYESEHTLNKTAGVWGSVVTEPVEMTVVSLLGEEAPPVLDIQRLKMPEENLFWPVFRKVGGILFLMGVICLGIYGAIRFFPKPVPHTLRENPVESSLRDLRELKKKVDREVLTVGHYEELSKILRRYLAKQFDPLTLHLTTLELRQKIFSYSPCRDIAEKACELLTIFDLVKFANRSVSKGEFDSFLNEIEAIIRSAEPSVGERALS